ncbi:MAG: GNAT family N-acetyltransferase [Patescibacteria group bacterium]|nr:GNAT family N-acetyltransferase [Patescibacteria group bacterium]
MNKLVPNNFKIPKILITEKFFLRMLTVDDATLDYEAVMESPGYLKGVFGPENPWPEDDLSFRKDLADLKWHQKEFKKRSSFAYTVMSPDKSRCLGCVYILPSDNRQYDAMVVLWVRKSELANGLDEKLFSVVQDWLDKKWPFKNIAYPGRKITWDKFLKN